MGDNVPDTRIALKRLEQQRLQIEANVKGCEIRLMEIEEERKRMETNLEASERALEELDEKLAATRKAVAEIG